MRAVWSAPFALVLVTSHEFGYTAGSRVKEMNSGTSHRSWRGQILESLGVGTENSRNCEYCSAEAFVCWRSGKLI